MVRDIIIVEVITEHVWELDDVSIMDSIRSHDDETRASITLDHINATVSMRSNSMTTMAMLMLMLADEAHDLEMRT